MNGKEDQVCEPTENKKARLETTERDTKLAKKRDDYIEWPEYFMAIAFLSAQRSKDPGRSRSASHLGCISLITCDVYITCGLQWIFNDSNFF